MLLGICWLPAGASCYCQAVQAACNGLQVGQCQAFKQISKAHRLATTRQTGQYQVPGCCCCLRMTWAWSASIAYSFEQMIRFLRQ